MENYYVIYKKYWKKGPRQGAHTLSTRVGARPRGAGVPPTLVDRWWAPWPSYFVGIFYIFHKFAP